MVSSSRQRNDVVQHCKAFDNRHFFKVVLADALKEHKLEIPKKFVREYGLKAFLNNQICLKVADGKQWNVGLKKSNGRVWLHDYGWKKFLEFYSIGFEYFLVFKYKPQYSTFHVVIFDLTATEVEYPINKIHLDHEHEEEKAKMETELNGFDLVSNPQDFKAGKVSFNTVEPMNGARKRPSTSQQASAMAKATNFQSKTLNPSFMCKIWASHIHGKYLMIPNSFTEMHLEKATEIILQVSDGRMWDARCHFYGASTMQKTASVRNGWKNFVIDNNLQYGDACVLEMISKTSRKICFKVQIFLAS